MRKLRYLGEPSTFVQFLISSNHRDSAAKIRQTLLGVCEQGLEHPEIAKHGEQEKMYRIVSLPGESDGLMHPGYEAIFLLLDEAVLVTEIRNIEL